MASGYEFQHGELVVRGYSAAGEETYLTLPHMNVGFDFGRAPRDVLAVDHVFLTHGHMDHAAGLAYYFSQRMFIDNAPGHAYIPQPLVAPVQEMLRIWGDIDGHTPPANVHGVAPGDDIQVQRDLIVRVFEVEHLCRGRAGERFNALGFSVINIRNKLKPEHQGLMGPQLVELKQRGVEITTRVEHPLVTYCGDTGPGAFLELDFVRRSQILLLECTFIDMEHRERARAGRHMHLGDIARIVPQLENQRIVLTHLTRRTGIHDAKRALRAVLNPADRERVSFLAEHRRQRTRTLTPKPSEAQP